jgi:hypothetical protein
MATRGPEDSDDEFSALTYLQQRLQRRRDRHVAVIRSRQEFRAYRASLDERVRLGEISRAARRRYLAGWHRQAARRLGEGPANRWLRRVVVGIVLLIGVAFLIAGSVQIGPAYAAAHGHGTPGYFVAVRTNTCDQNRHCSWDGTFRSWNGRDIRADVHLDGTWSGVAVGTKIPALDSGDPFAVYPRTGSEHWREDLIWLALGTLIVVPWLWVVLFRQLRRGRWPTVQRLLRRI